MNSDTLFRYVLETIDVKIGTKKECIRSIYKS